MRISHQGRPALRFSDKELGNYVTKKLALPGDERNEYREQGSFERRGTVLLDRMEHPAIE